MFLNLLTATNLRQNIMFSTRGKDEATHTKQDVLSFRQALDRTPGGSGF